MIQWPVDILECKYRKWYESLVEKAKNRIFPEGEYGEGHHVIPRSLGGSNDVSNVVRLYPREHYIAHLLLWKMKMTPKMHNKMTMALHVMVNGSGNQKQNRSYLVPSRVYEISRRAYSKLLSVERSGSGNSFYGKKHTPETLEKIKEANKRTKDIRSAKLKGENNGMYGKTHSEEVRKTISENVKKRFEDPELKEKMSSIMADRWTDPEYRQHMIDIRQTSEGWLNRDWKAIAAKSAAGRKANGTDKRTPEQRKKFSEKVKAQFASGERIPYNKGTRKPKPIYTEEEKLQRKLDGIEKMRASKLAKKENGWVNPTIGKARSPEVIAKIKATMKAKQEAGLAPKRKPWSEETKKRAVEKANATKAAKKAAGWVSPNKGVPHSKEHVANRVASRIAKNEERRLAEIRLQK